MFRIKSEKCGSSFIEGKVVNQDNNLLRIDIILQDGEYEMKQGILLNKEEVVELVSQLEKWIYKK